MAILFDTERGGKVAHGVGSRVQSPSVWYWKGGPVGMGDCHPGRQLRSVQRELSERADRRERCPPSM